MVRTRSSMLACSIADMAARKRRRAGKSKVSRRSGPCEEGALSQCEEKASER